MQQRVKCIFYSMQSQSKRPKYEGAYNMDYHRERVSHVRGVNYTQDTSRMGTARVKQDEEADTIIIAKE